MRNGAKKFYNLPDDEAKMWKDTIIPQSYEVQKTILTREAWKYVPSTYLVCENDQAAPAKFQEGFAEMSRSTIVRCSAGHSPMLSQTAILMEKIVEAVESSVNKELSKET